MLKKILFLACFAYCLVGQAQQQLAIDFIDNDYQSALAEASDQNKIIFVDAYAEWCGPCKMMDRNVFSDTAVGKFFNSHFINLKLDMEKGEGPKLSELYRVRAYPTFLFLDAKGALLHRGLGYHTSEKLLQLAEDALDPEKQLSALKTSYQEGNREPDFLRRFALSLFEATDTSAYTVGKAYLETQSNWAAPVNIPLIAQMAREYNDPYYNFMVEKRYLFIRHLGEGTVHGRLLNMIEDHLYSSLETLDLTEAKSIYTSTFPSSKAGAYYEIFEINYYDHKGRLDKYRDLARAFVKKYSTLSWSTLNELAWGFYEKIDDPKALKWAVKWAAKSISLNSNPYNNDTLAALYYKLGNQKKASKFAQAAIELAQAAGIDYSETSRLLEKIERMN